METAAKNKSKHKIRWRLLYPRQIEEEEDEPERKKSEQCMIGEEECRGFDGGAREENCTEAHDGGS
ncbi:hypothetical protein OROGR_004727 [Orobanche gracilis]